MAYGGSGLDYFISSGVHHSMKSDYNIHTIWVVMMLLTISTYTLGKLNLNGLGIVFFILLTTVIKGFFIIRDFMELKGVSLLWRVIMYGWLWTICLAISMTYIISYQGGI